MTILAQPLPLNDVRPDPRQPRKLFEEGEIAGLWSSLRENGLQQPIKVRRDPVGGYVVVFGERRYRAHVYGGAETIDAVVDDSMCDIGKARVAQLIENDQRVDVTALERGQSYLDAMAENGWSVEELGKRIGKHPRHITCWTDLLKPKAEYQALLASGNLQAGVLLEMARLSGPGQDRLFKAIKRGLCPTAKDLKAVAPGIRNDEDGSSALFAMPEPPTKAEVKAAESLERKIASVCEILAAGFDDNEIVATRKIDPSKAATTADKLSLIRKHLADIEHALRASAAVQTDLLAAA